MISAVDAARYTHVAAVLLGVVCAGGLLWRAWRARGLQRAYVISAAALGLLALTAAGVLVEPDARFSMTDAGLLAGLGMLVFTRDGSLARGGRALALGVGLPLALAHLVPGEPFGLHPRTLAQLWGGVFGFAVVLWRARDAAPAARYIAHMQGLLLAVVALHSPIAAPLLIVFRLSHAAPRAYTLWLASIAVGLVGVLAGGPGLTAALAAATVVSTLRAVTRPRPAHATPIARAPAAPAPEPQLSPAVLAHTPRVWASQAREPRPVEHGVSMDTVLRQSIRRVRERLPEVGADITSSVPADALLHVCLHTVVDALSRSMALLASDAQVDALRVEVALVGDTIDITLRAHDMTGMLLRPGQQLPAALLDTIDALNTAAPAPLGPWQRHAEIARIEAAAAAHDGAFDMESQAGTPAWRLRIPAGATPPASQASRVV